MLLVERLAIVSLSYFSVAHVVTDCFSCGVRPRLLPVKIKSSANPDLFAPFRGRVVCGDDERLQRGKPFADVFLLAAREGLGEPEKWQPIVREPGPQHDGTFKGGEGQFLVFEDATVSQCLGEALLLQTV